MVFNIITFSLFWLVYRYNTLYVTKFRFDTGGLLYPKAINQLFTGLYVMELCLIGLFFLVRNSDQKGRAVGTPCKGQAIIMIVVFFCTIIYQVLLNRAFSPLFRYLPITLEDDAVVRDEEFARFQEKRWNVVHNQGGGEDINAELEERARRSEEENKQIEEFEMQRIHARKEGISLNQGTLAVARNRTSWLKRPRKWQGHDTLKVEEDDNVKDPRKNDIMKASDNGDGVTEEEHHVADKKHATKKAEAKHNLRQLGRNGLNDTEAHGSGPNAIGEALFAGISDEIEDLTPDERDKLVQHAFQHEALRAKRPVVWIPRDEMGVSDDEIYRTQRLSKHIWISNEYTGLDGKCRVVYRRSPPDFSEIDLIEL
jgi:calcium permeable stress-gated cation channel